MRIIDGKATAAAIRSELKKTAEALEAKAGRKPGLAVILVGDDSASQTYVRNKERACIEVGMHSEVLRLPAETRQEDLAAHIKDLNARPDIDGILLQLPLPAGLDSRRCLEHIAPDKDVDGFHPVNMGKLMLGLPGLKPCTPAGVMGLIHSTGVSVSGKECVVVGRSNIVGKPMALMLLNESATVTVCHSRTRDLGEVTRRADILVSAVGKANLITADMVKEGAIVIDVGMNRDSSGKLCGDIDFAAVSEKASYITPVPGGVGPMTRAMLMQNTLTAKKLQ